MTLRKILIQGSFLFMLLAALLFRALGLGGEEAGTAAPTPAGAPPYAVRGPHAVGVRTFAADEQRPLALTIWYPAPTDQSGAAGTSYPYEIKLPGPFSMVAIAATPGQALPEAGYDRDGGPYPLVILSPGFALGGRSYAWLAEHLATYGFVVIAPEHQERLNPSAIWQAMIKRPRDIRTLLATVDQQAGAGGAWAGLIDPQRVAVAGHSLGGYTALAAAGARIDSHGFQALCAGARQTDQPHVWLCDILLPRLPDMAEQAGIAAPPGGLWPDWREGRVDAIMPLAGDAYLFGADGLAEITVPVLAIGGTSDSDTPYQWGTQPTYEFVSSARKARIGLVGAEHMIFTGPCTAVHWYARIATAEFCAGSTWTREQAHKVIQHFTTAFLLAELKQDEDAAGALAADAVDLPGITYDAQGY